MKNLVLVFLLAFAPLGCRAYVNHPGSINTADSQIYDSLIAAKATIDVARVQFDNGVLPAKLKPAVNDIVKAYDVAMPAYKLWHDAAQKGQPADAMLASLNLRIAELTKAINAFKGAK